LRAIDSAIVALNNLVVRGRRKRVKPGELLLLLPACLQNSQCSRNLAHDIFNCGRCGKCSVAALLELAEHYGVKPFIASGGRLAAIEAKKPEVKAIVAVACQKELREGILAVLPKAVMAIVNLRPHGPCKDCSVNTGEVESAIRGFLGLDGGDE